MNKEMTDEETNRPLFKIGHYRFVLALADSWLADKISSKKMRLILNLGFTKTHSMDGQNCSSSLSLGQKKNELKKKQKNSKFDGFS